MHPKIYREFERICSGHHVTGRVLEVGAIPSPDSLLCMRALEHATEKIGVNIDGPYTYRDFTIRKANANNLDLFDDGRFDTTLCNGVLEHDKFFWKTISEIQRVTRAGGLIVIAAPGYARSPAIRFLREDHLLVRALKKMRWLPFVPALFRSTPTLEIHNAPGDYYRFSTQMFEEVLFAGMEDVRVYPIMFPPIIIGTGTKRPSTQ